MESPTYWQKQEEKPLFSHLEWNLPEQKTGSINLIGGNINSFAPIIHTAEFLSQHYPIKTINLILPDALKTQLPPLPNAVFLPSTNSGSFDKTPELAQLTDAADFSIFLGDFSKNSTTTIAIADAIKDSSAPIVLARDTIGLILPESTNILERKQFFIIASMLQLQKLFQSCYYPKMIMLSMPLLPAVEALHKFTLSYQVTITTFHEGQIIIASRGKIATILIEKTPYSPLSLWSGELASKIAIMNLFNPKNPFEATVAAVNLH